MTPEERKEFILSTIKNEGNCRPHAVPDGSNYICDEECIITETQECFRHRAAYEKAVSWMREYYPDILLEHLI